MNQNKPNNQNIRRNSFPMWSSSLKRWRTLAKLLSLLHWMEPTNDQVTINSNALKCKLFSFLFIIGFGNFLNLVPLAENVVKLTAVCMHCYGEAAFTQRLGSETEVSSVLSFHQFYWFCYNYLFIYFSKVELIGGSEKYMAVCRECYRKFSEANNESLAEDCCHGNRVSSPFHQLHQRPNNKSPLKVNNSPTKHLTVQVNRILFLDKENL